MFGHTVGFDVEKIVVGPCLDERMECVEAGSDGLDVGVVSTFGGAGLG